MLDGFNQQLAAMKVTPASVTSYKRGASDFSAQIAKMKADGCDMVVLGTVIRETIGAMGEAKKLGWDVTFLGATPTNVLEVPGARQGSGRRALCGLRLRNSLRRHRQGQGQGLAGQLQEDVRHRRQHAGDHRLQRRDDLCPLCREGRQGPDRAEDARRAGVGRRSSSTSSTRRRPSSPRPTIWPTPSPRCSRSRMAAGCWSRTA